MAGNIGNNKEILIYAGWEQAGSPLLMGILKANSVRGKEIFSFSYDNAWLEKEIVLLLDPGLALYAGPQYNPEDKPNFGLFTDSSPDRWGRVLMENVRRWKRVQKGVGQENCWKVITC